MSTEGGAVLAGRNAAPSHYLFKIESFSLLSKASVEQLILDNFEAGGYKWKLSIHLTGSKSVNVTDHISIYLELAETSSLPTGWEVNAITISLYSMKFKTNILVSKVRNSTISNCSCPYVIVKHFHAMKSKYGVAKFIDLKTFSDPLNGYLVNDACVFGAEVFVVKNTFKGECLSMMHDPPTYYHTLKVSNFSSLLDEFYESESFGCYKWKILLYPNGNGEANGNCISLFLDVSRSSIPPNIKLLTKYFLCVENQMNGKNSEVEGEWLYTLTNHAIGGRQFMTLAKLKYPTEGYLVDDSCIIKAEVTLHGLVLAET
ncbi:TRAF-like family protein [Citrus sinensis]|nr:TRAF-like family protein [Citrus sinensis]